MQARLFFQEPTEEGNDIKLTNHELFLLTAAQFIFW
jgi:hypothetical protein